MKKPKIKYYLKASDKNPNKRTKEELIQARIHSNFVESIDGITKYNSFFVSLKCSIKPKNFGLIKDNFKFNEDIFNNFSRQNKGVKTAMQHFEQKVDDLFSYYLINGVNPDATQFKNDLLIQLGRNKREVSQVTTILNYLNKKIEYFENLKNSGRKDEISENTIKPYRTLAYYIERYELHKNSKLTFQNLNETTYWDFWDFQDEVLKGNIKLPKIAGRKSGTISKNGFLLSSIRKYQKTLFRILKMAQAENIKVELNTSNSNLIVEDKPNSKDIYINEEQLLKIWEFVPKSDDLQLAKDYVILSSLTGMRYESMQIAHEQEIECLSEDNYKFNYIHSFQNKTNTECLIPLLEPVEKTLVKYNNKFPILPQNAILNKLVKNLFIEVGITATATEISYTYKSGIIKEVKDISELITLHDCRKSFVTNLLISNASENIVMSVTHPNAKSSHAMATIYNKSNMLDKAKQFYDEVNRINKTKKSQLYTF